MKNIQLTTTTTVNPTNFAIEQLNVQSGQYVIQLVIFRPDVANNEVTVKVQSINCKLRNIRNYEKFARLFACAYYTQATNTNNSKIADIEKKELESALTGKEVLEKTLREEIAIELDVILAQFDATEKLFVSTDSFVNLMSGALTGDFTICHKSSGASITSIVSMLGTKANVADVKKAVTDFTLKVTGSNDDIYNGYHLNCNNALVEDIKCRYYKGRKYNKSGSVVKSYDTKGASVEKEIALAIVEDLQKKAQDVATDNEIEACAVEKK